MNFLFGLCGYLEGADANTQPFRLRVGTDYLLIANVRVKRAFLRVNAAPCASFLCEGIEVVAQHRGAIAVLCGEHGEQHGGGCAAGQNR